MGSRERCVETTAKIATRASPAIGFAVESLLPMGSKEGNFLRRIYPFRVLFRRKPKRALEPPGVGRPHLGVNDARRSLAVQRGENLFGGDFAHIDPGFP